MALIIGVCDWDILKINIGAAGAHGRASAGAAVVVLVAVELSAGVALLAVTAEVLAAEVPLAWQLSLRALKLWTVVAPVVVLASPTAKQIYTG